MEDVHALPPHTQALPGRRVLCHLRTANDPLRRAREAKRPAVCDGVEPKLEELRAARAYDGHGSESAHRTGWPERSHGHR